MAALAASVTAAVLLCCFGGLVWRHRAEKRRAMAAAVKALARWRSGGGRAGEAGDGWMGWPKTLRCLG